MTTSRSSPENFRAFFVFVWFAVYFSVNIDDITHMRRAQREPDLIANRKASQ